MALFEWNNEERQWGYCPVCMQVKDGPHVDVGADWLCAECAEKIAIAVQGVAGYQCPVCRCNFLFEETFVEHLSRGCKHEPKRVVRVSSEQRGQERKAPAKESAGRHPASP